MSALELAAQFAAFRVLMETQPAQTPKQADLLGTSVRAADASCLNAPITALSCMIASSV